MDVVDSTTGISVPSRLASTLAEIGKHHAAIADEKIERERTAALYWMATTYIDEYGEDFEKNGEYQYRFTGLGGDDE